MGYRFRAPRIQRDDTASVSWLMRCRAICTARALTVAAPLVLTMLFASVITAHDSSPFIITSQPPSPMSRQVSLSPSVLGATSPDTVAANRDETPSSAASSDTATTPLRAGSSQELLPGMTDTLNTTTALVCDTAAKALALTTYTTAMAAENTRHTAQLTLIHTSGLIQSLLVPAHSDAEDQEDALHIAKVNAITSTYQASLQKAHCV